MKRGCSPVREAVWAPLRAGAAVTTSRERDELLGWGSHRGFPSEDLTPMGIGGCLTATAGVPVAARILARDSHRGMWRRRATLWQAARKT